jgi:uncharacterized protein YndB with AHSA1/START domain
MDKLSTKMLIKANGEQIYNAFTKAKAIGNFWFDSSSEDWQTGKCIRLIYKQYQANFTIDIIKADKNSPIIYTWDGLGNEKRKVVINFTSTKEGETLVEITEENWPDNLSCLNEMVDNKGGWVCVLLCLKAYLEEGITTLRTGYLG